MTYSVRVFLAGLVALVRDRAGRLHVLLPNAAHHHHHVHHPVLLCDPERADCRLSGPSQGTEIAARLRSRAPLAGYLLDGEEVALRGALPGRVAPLVGRWRRRWYHDVAGTRPGSREECSDCGWIARMGAADPQRGVIAPRHLDNPRREEVAAKLSLAGVQGELRAFRMAEVCGRIVSFTFKRPSARLPVRAYRQALAAGAVVELAADRPVTFELSPLGGRDAAAAVPRTLTVAPKDGTAQVDVLLANFSPPLPCPCVPGFVPPPSYHFEHYYHLAATPVPPWEGMLPLPHCGVRGVAADGLQEPWPPVLHAVYAAGDAQVSTGGWPPCTPAFFDPD